MITSTTITTPSRPRTEEPPLVVLDRSKLSTAFAVLADDVLLWLAQARGRKRTR
jgi:hypothetical protein